MVGKNLWQQNMHISQSIRTGKFDEAFNLKAPFEQGSGAYLGKLYKKALLQNANMKG